MSSSHEPTAQKESLTSETKILSKTAKRNTSQDFWKSIATVISWQNQAPPLTTVARDRPISLSFGQERLWFLDRLDPSKSSAYNMPFAFKITGCLDMSALKQSLSRIVGRHEALRTAFETVEGKTVQIVRAESEIDLPVVKLGNILLQQQETKVRQLIEEEVKRPFDLSQGTAAACHCARERGGISTADSRPSHRR